MFRIFAHLSPAPLGDFVGHALLISSIAELFDDCELTVQYRDDRPYKTAIAECMRNVKTLVRLATPNTGIPIEYFNRHSGRMILKSDPMESNQVWAADLLLSGSMLNDGMLSAIPLTTLRPPAEKFAANRDKLVALGLDPDRWVACVYWKELGYEFRGDKRIRVISNPAPYFAVIRHIIEDLGGQVVRLGHPTATRVPAERHFIDLAHIAGTEELQAFAVSISRFFIASGSGPASYGPAFGVPTAVTDQTMCYGAWRSHDYILTQKIIHEGRRLWQQSAYDAGVLYPDWVAPDSTCYVRNAPEQLVAATDEMFNITTNCTSWRTLTAPPPLLPRPNRVTLPLPQVYRPDLLIPPSLRK